MCTFLPKCTKIVFVCLDRSGELTAFLDLLLNEAGDKDGKEGMEKIVVSIRGRTGQRTDTKEKRVEKL